MIKKVSLLISIILMISYCHKKKFINEDYLELHYEYIIDSNQSIDARISYLNKLISSATDPDAPNSLKKKSLNYLERAYIFLNKSKSLNDIQIHTIIKNIFTSIGKSVDELNKLTAKDLKKKWFEIEKNKKQKKAHELTSSSEWDNRIYGRWVKVSPYFIEQYDFYHDTSFQYIKVIISQADESYDFAKSIKNIGRVSDSQRGNYTISKDKNKLTLIFSEGKKDTQIFRYFIDDNRLEINKEEFFKKTGD
ncbi:MAG: hypothetical protein OEV44_07175 [Spirochaetota bacterium]|nr:hypothetical protein [Spirochaetota bacterium]